MNCLGGILRASALQFVCAAMRYDAVQALPEKESFKRYGYGNCSSKGGAVSAFVFIKSTVPREDGRLLSGTKMFVADMRMKKIRAGRLNLINL